MSRKKKFLQAQLTGKTLTDETTGQVYEQALVPFSDANNFRQDDQQTSLVGRIWAKIRPVYKDETSEADDHKTTDIATGNIVGGGPIAEAYYERMEMENDRKSLYSDWSKMDSKSVLARRALAVTISNAFPSREGDESSHEIVSDDKKVKTILDELDERVGMAEFAPQWGKTTLKFGDSFIERVIDEKNMIMRLKWLNPYYMFRNEDRFGRLDADEAFIMKSDQQVIGTFAYFQVGHTRFEQDLSSMYGTSFFYPGRVTYRQLEMMKEGVVIRRLTKSSKRYAMYVPVPPGAPIEQKNKIINEVKQSLRREKFSDSSGRLNTRRRPAIEEQDIFLPTWEGSPAKVEMFDPGNVDDALTDLIFFRDEEIVAYGVPPSHLGLDKEVRGRAHLSWSDIQFARTVRSIDKMMATAQREIYDLQLVLLGMPKAEYKVKYPAISFVDERLKMEVEKMKWEVAMIARSTLGIPMKWVLMNIMKLGENEVDEILIDGDYKDSDMGTQFPGGDSKGVNLQNAFFSNSQLMGQVAGLRDKMRYIIDYGLNKSLEV